MASAVSDLTPKPAVAEAAEKGRQRLLSLDVFRGLTILAMILVNNPGQWGDQFWPLKHADWHGWTPTDLIFPFFLFIVGTSLAYSLRKYRDGEQIDPAVYWRILRRTLTLIFLGWMPTLLLRSFGFLVGKSETLAQFLQRIHYTLDASQTFDLSTLRLPGVLVRIALVYFITSLIVLNARVRGQVVIGTVLLLGYWALLGWLPDTDNYESNLSPSGNLVRVVDLKLIGDKHMYTQAKNEKTDPEGLLSTLPAVVTALLGYWTGLVLQRRGINWNTVGFLVACGVLCAAIGLGWGLVFPINKKIWTSSFVLLTAGLAMIFFAGCLAKFDILGWRRLGRTFEIVGINAIFVFVASGLFSIFVLSKVHIGDVSLHTWIYHNLFTSWLHDQKLASLGFALLTVAFWWFLAWVMSRLGWSIRV